jgi:predicted TIM-barrel fold metal-dependent hydrolase
MRIIDAHIHIPREDPSGVGSLVRAAERNGIGALCFSSLGTWEYEPSLEACIRANGEVKWAMDKFPEMVVGLCYVNPASGEAGLREFERCIEDYKMRGLKLWVARKCTDPSVDPFVEAAIEYDVPILQHSWLKSTGNLPHESTPQDVAEMASKYPDASIIMAHIGGDWEIGAQAVKDHRNVMVDTCGTICDAGMIEYVVAMLGAERVVYGSDNCDFAGQVAKILSAEIKEEEKELILSGNIERVMRI